MFKFCHKSSVCHSALRRCFSKTVTIFKDNNKTDERVSLPGTDAEITNESIGQKFSYPEINVPPKLINFPYEVDEHPVERTKKALKFDYDTFKARIQGTRPPALPHESDIIVVGGGLIGTAIAHQLVARCGHGIKVSILEKDSPYLSKSIDFGRNDLYQQVPLKPHKEMAEYAAEFYRTLCMHHDDPDLPKMSLDFQPNSSLQLASEKDAKELEDLAHMYRECDWKHQLLTSSLLKEKFPWLNVDGVALGCLGMNREGIFNKWKALSAMRVFCKKHQVTFIEGKLVGFEFIDQTDLLTGYEQQARYFAPRRIVVQSKTGELTRHTFGYLIFATGVSTKDLTDRINIANVDMKVPIGTEERFSFNFECPGGPGIEMPMIMESSGLRVRKSDIVNYYTAWEEQPPPKEALEKYTSGSMNDYFAESVLPRLIQRVPSFKNSQLLSSDSALLDVCTWDNNLVMGPILGFYNVLHVGGLASDEFLYAPAAARGMAELILDREFEAIDLGIFRHERIDHNIKITEVIESFLKHNKNY